MTKHTSIADQLNIPHETDPHNGTLTLYIHNHRAIYDPDQLQQLTQTQFRHDLQQLLIRFSP